MVVPQRLSRELHGSGGYTSLSRLLAGFGMVVALGLVVQLLGTSWYMGRLLPGTVIGDQNVSDLTVAQAHLQLAKMASRSHIQLTIGDNTYTFTSEQLGVSFDVDGTLEAAYDQQHARGWLTKPASGLVLAHQVSTPKLAEAVGTVAEAIGTQPVDATLVVTNGQLKPVPDKDGFTVDKAGLARLIRANLGTVTAAKLVAAPHRQTADIRLASLDTTMSAARSWMATPITLSYQDRTWTPTAAVIGSWLTFTKTDDPSKPALVPQVDRSKVKGYVQTVAKQADLAPINELVTVQNGARTVNQAGVNGMAIDQDPAVVAIANAVAAQSALAFTFTDHVVPYKSVVTNFTVLDYPKYIEINLSKQHGWVWENGQIIYDMPITSGATGAGFPTVTGTFAIYYKTTNTHLVGRQYGPRYDYDVAVKYWMPFYQGYGLHDASWRNGKFGGSDYYYGGSHGCVNLPDAAAAFIYNWSDIGTPVWVHN